MVYTKIIDRAKWDNGPGQWTVLVNLGRGDYINKGVISIEVNDQLMQEIKMEELGYSGWVETEHVDWKNDSIKVTIKSREIKREDGVFLIGQKNNNFGLSLVNNKFGSLLTDRELLNGTYEIGISRTGDLWNRVPVWYGSSTYSTRQRLLIEHYEENN